MKINGGMVFVVITFIIVIVFVVLLYLMDTHRELNGTTYIANLTGDQSITQQKVVPVVIINLSDDGAIDTEQALMRGDLYLLMKYVDARTKIFFNNVDDLQQLDEYQRGILNSGNEVYAQLEVGQFTNHGRGFVEQSLVKAGVVEVEFYPEPKQFDKYGQAIGEVVMADGNRYPLQIVQVDSKYLTS
ncbi:MAG: hypothetical protein HY939_07410 [Gammaproteobacteria bacterium]|nr:hypothetical protein [Gammaproteobacteria bacterium]